MAMSNTWQYRFAFRLEGERDIPPEFQSSYDRLVRAHGAPVFGLFTPALEEHGLLLSHWLPPRVILVFPHAFVLLSLETKSDGVGILEVVRADFLGFGFAEFMLSCWFTLYHGYSGAGKTVIGLPSRAAENYWELSRVLLGWCCQEGAVPRDTLEASIDLAGFPARFSSFLRAHPEFGTVTEFFFQPAMERRGKRRGGFPDLLLATMSNGVLALTDQSRHHRSEAGLEMTFLPLGRVQSAGWMEPSQDGSALLRVDLHGSETTSQLTWRVFTGLKPYAFHWIRALNDAAHAARQTQQGPEVGLPASAARGDAIPIS
jgi:hypothetical protein